MLQTGCTEAETFQADDRDDKKSVPASAISSRIVCELVRCQNERQVKDTDTGAEIDVSGSFVGEDFGLRLCYLRAAQ